MKIQTQRLHLIALQAEQLELLAKDPAQLEAEWQCTYRGEPVKGVYQSILLGQVAKVLENPDTPWWHTFWVILEKESRTIVGTIDFKNTPDAQGNVEIGYGLGAGQRHRGYMTEAVRAFCAWGKQQDGVRCILAQTETENTASQRVLQRCGFTVLHQAETIWWKF